jgi:hypothetical protein
MASKATGRAGGVNKNQTVKPIRAAAAIANTVPVVTTKPVAATSTIVPAQNVEPGTLNPGSTVSRPEVTSTDPYIRAGQQAVQGYYDAYAARRQGLIDAANARFNEANTSYNASAKRTYGNYLEAQKASRSRASDNGMTGGAIERMNVDSANNYNRGYAANEAGRMKTLSGIQTQYDSDAINALVDYQNTATNTMANAWQAYQQAADQKAADEANRKLQQDQFNAQQKMQQKQFDYQKNQDKLNRYAETVGQYNSRKKVNKAISKMKKSDDPNKKEKLQILRAQAAKFKNKKKKK